MTPAQLYFYHRAYALGGSPSCCRQSIRLSHTAALFQKLHSYCTQRLRLYLHEHCVLYNHVAGAQSCHSVLGEDTVLTI